MGSQHARPRREGQGAGPHLTPEYRGHRRAPGCHLLRRRQTFYQIADYTGDPSWNQPAQACAALYREAMVLPLQGKVKGWRIFPHGLYEDYRRTGNAHSRDALILMSKNADFAREGTPFADTENEALSREVAYNLNTFLTVMKLGEPMPSRLPRLYEQALGHLDQWFVHESSPDYAPFMFGLTAEALIGYYEQVHPDPRIIAGLQTRLRLDLGPLLDPAGRSLLVSPQQPEHRRSPQPARRPRLRLARQTDRRHEISRTRRPTLHRRRPPRRPRRRQTLQPELPLELRLRRLARADCLAVIRATRSPNLSAVLFISASRN